MTMIVGYAPDERGDAALHLGGMLARSAGDDLVICSVVPAPWLPGMARVDTEYRDFLDTAAEKALELAESRMPPGATATYVKHSARSAPAGLLELAEHHDARLIVLGSSSGGALGHVSFGSVTDRLLHSSPVTLALAPRGFRCARVGKVTRVTAAYGGSSAESLVVAAAAVGASVGATLRVASFAVSAPPAYTTALGTESEELVIQEWLASLERTANDALDQVESLPKAPGKVEVVVGRGATWEAALEDISWEAGDVLVVGSSAIGPVAQVFLGSRATKIVRHSPVPVVAVPQSRAEALADQATEPGSEDR